MIAHRNRFMVLATALTLLVFFLWSPSRIQLSDAYDRWSHERAFLIKTSIMNAVSLYAETSTSNTAFGEMGIRAEHLSQWLDQAAELRRSLSEQDNDELQRRLEQAVLATFPFLKADSKHSQPLQQLRQRVIPGSKGIVIAAGKSHFRYLCHLLANLRTVLKSGLPIEIMYAGEHDLPQRYRDALLVLFPFVELVDTLPFFNDELVDLPHGTWAIKPFSILVSKFEHVIGIDADAVFVQRPEALFDQAAFVSRGALLFHDRLLWQNMFEERHKWWNQELLKANRAPSDTLMRSKVWTEGFAEECDSGVVVFDKSRTPILLGLLHVAWQNSKVVRQEVTYKVTYGDKESWWFGLELSGVPFDFERYYGSVIGEAREQDGQIRVCGFTIAHLDDDDELLWYNGSLLKNKAANLTEFLVPSSWMVGGEWLKGATKAEESCMRSVEARKIDSNKLGTIVESVEEAQHVDRVLVGLGFSLQSTAELRGS
jgi:alpha 1,3-mannosyltransferase